MHRRNVAQTGYVVLRLRLQLFSARIMQRRHASQNLPANT